MGHLTLGHWHINATNLPSCANGMPRFPCRNFLNKSRHYLALGYTNTQVLCTGISDSGWGEFPVTAHVHLWMDRLKVRNFLSMCLCSLWVPLGDDCLYPHHASRTARQHWCQHGAVAQCVRLIRPTQFCFQSESFKEEGRVNFLGFPFLAWILVQASQYSTTALNEREPMILLR